MGSEGVTSTPPRLTVEERQQVEYTGAGVLPYCYFGGELLFFLGKELYSQGKRESLVWSDFGGRREESDVCVEHTAAREFSEETLGLFEDISLSKSSVSACTARMTEILKNRSHDSKGPGRIYTVQNGLYTMFLCEVKFVEDLMFQLGTAEIGQEVEKLDFVWVTAKQMIE